MRLGILGAGNMGEAILRGALAGGAILAADTMVYDINGMKTQRLARELHVRAAESVERMAGEADLVLLAVKPQVCPDILREYGPLFSQKGVISIVAGWSRARLAASLPADVRILRVMPNTPAMMGEGMIVFEKGDTLTEQEHAFAKTLFCSLGKVDAVENRLMDAVTAVSGSGPAYVYMFIEAMGDAGVRAGLPRSTAYELAAQTVLGSAKMVLATGLHPGELKDRVCSPGGTTIEAVAALEADGFRSAVMDAVKACCEKSIQMGK